MNIDSWIQLFFLLSGGATIIILAAAFGSRFVGPVWQRAVWRSAFALLLILVGLECGGIRSLRFPVQDPKPALSLDLSVAPILMIPHSIAVPAKADPVRSQVIGPVSISPTPSRTTWVPLMLWLAGTVLLCARCLMGRIGMMIYSTNLLPNTDSLLRSKIETLANKVGLTAKFRIFTSPALSGTAAFGIIRRTLCLPDTFQTSFTECQQSAMIAHELEHLRSRDPAWSLLVELVTAIWWWFPLVWWARKEMSVATELAADEACLIVEQGPSVLADTLVALASKLDTRRPTQWLGIEGGKYRSGLGRRVMSLLRLENKGMPRQRQKFVTPIMCASSIMLLFLILAIESSIPALAQESRSNLAQALLNPRGRANNAELVQFFKQAINHPPEIDLITWRNQTFFIPRPPEAEKLLKERFKLLNEQNKWLGEKNIEIPEKSDSYIEAAKYGNDFVYASSSWTNGKPAIHFDPNYLQVVGGYQWRYYTVFQGNIQYPSNVRFEEGKEPENWVPSAMEGYRRVIDQSLMMGAGSLKQGTVKWTGNRFTAEMINDKRRTAGIVLGELSISNGLPARLSFRYTPNSPLLYYIEYEYPEVANALGGYPQKMRMYTLKEGKWVNWATLETLECIGRRSMDPAPLLPTNTIPGLHLPLFR